MQHYSNSPKITKTTHKQQQPQNLSFIQKMKDSRRNRMGGSPSVSPGGIESTTSDTLLQPSPSNNSNSIRRTLQPPSLQNTSLHPNDANTALNSPSSRHSNTVKSPSSIASRTANSMQSFNDTAAPKSQPFDMLSAKKRAWLTFVKKQKDELKLKQEFEYLVHLEAENRDIVETMLDEKIQKQNASFYKFLWDKDGYNDQLADRFFSLTLIYISSLIRLEKLKLMYDMMPSDKSINGKRKMPRMGITHSEEFGTTQETTLDSTAFSPSSSMKSTNSSNGTTLGLTANSFSSTTSNARNMQPQLGSTTKKGLRADIQRQKRTSYDYLVQLSFAYSLILQRYRFEKDSAREKQFFETLYTVVSRLVCSRFENQSLHSIIETEVERLFRSEHFFIPQREKNDLKYFISTEDQYRLRRRHHVKLPLGNAKSSIAHSKKQSPLMSRVFPVDTAKVNEYINDMRLDIPAESILFDSQKRKKSATKNMVSQLEEEISSGEMNGKDATLIQLQLKALYELESTTRSAKNARELLEKSMY